MKIQQPSYAAPESGGGSDTSESEQDLAQLADMEESDAETTDDSDEPADEPEEEDKPAKKSAKSDTDEEDEEPSEGDTEEPESDESDDDEETDSGEGKPSYARLPVKALKAKYPNLFKDFPQLKTAFFNYPQFAEIFSDPESARDAAQKASEYDTLEATLVGKGDAKPLLETLSENNPKALKKMVGGFADAVRKVDSSAYVELATPIIEELLYHAAAHGTKTGNKNLGLAARHIANFVFANGGDIPDISKRLPQAEPSDAEKELAREREQYAKEKFQGALGDVIELIKPDMNQILGNKLDGLTSFERKQIIKEAGQEVDRILSGDKAFQSSLRALWAKAEKTGYSSEAKSRIKRAWIERARLVAPGIRNKLKNEALAARNGGNGKKDDDKQEDTGSIKFKVTDEKRKFPDRGGKTPSGQTRTRVLDPKKIDWRKTTDRDILDMK